MYIYKCIRNHNHGRRKGEKGGREGGKGEKIKRRRRKKKKGEGKGEEERKGKHLIKVKSVNSAVEKVSLGYPQTLV